MGRADTPTKLSLARWAQIMGIHPLHFEQVTLPDNPPSVCEQPWLQHPWQAADRIGREDLAIAIRHAEDNIERELKTRLRPSWEVDEWRPTLRTIRPELTNLSITDIRAKGQLAEAKWMHFVSGGIQEKTVVEAGASITWSDSDGDGYEETGTVTAAISFADPCEVYIYYPGKSGADIWEIRPINVSIAGGTATITFRRELAVLETLQEAFQPVSVDGTDDANFLTTVDVYRKRNDPQQQVNFLWEPFATCGSCDGSGCPTCAYTTQVGCLIARDRKLSVVSYHPATWDSVDEEFDAAEWTVKRQPDIVRLWYYAGLRDMSSDCPNRNMPTAWERTVSYYAAALLDRPICECNNVHAWIDHWRRDLAIAGEEDLKVNFDLLDNPLGTTRGAVNAWKEVLRARELAQMIAV